MIKTHFNDGKVAVNIWVVKNVCVIDWCWIIQVRLTRGNIDASMTDKLQVLEMAADTSTQRRDFVTASAFWQDWLALSMMVPRDNYDDDTVAAFVCCKIAD